MDNKRTAAIKRIKKIWLMTALVMALGITLYFLLPNWQRIKEFTFWGDLGFTFLLVSDGLFLVGFPIIWLLLRNKFSPPLKHWELNTFLQEIHPPKELGRKDIWDLFPPGERERFEKEQHTLRQMKKDKRIVTLFPLSLSTIFIPILVATVYHHGWIIILEKTDVFFLVCVMNVIAFQLSYFFLWFGNRYNNGQRLPYYEIDPVLRLVIKLIKTLKQTMR